ncbi:MAG: (d)CMP kinase [Gemmataceae bacterium]
MIITIDGPAGAGKSSAARLLAQRLGFAFLDTGATFRAVALALRRAGVAEEDDAALAALLPTLRIDMPPGRVLLNGEDVSEAIRAPDVTAAAGRVAARPVVRHFLAQLQRRLAEGRDMVCEGRDQGTVVFPDALCKFFLEADPVERARRRQRDLAERGEPVALEEVLQAQQERDQRDAARALAPMTPADDAIRIDSTSLTLEEVVSLLERHVRERMKGTCCP